MVNQSITQRTIREFSAATFLVLALCIALSVPASARSRSRQVAGDEQQPAAQAVPSQPSPEQPANVESPPAPVDPVQLVRIAVYNEIKDNSQGKLYSWMERKKRGRNIVVEHDIQTPEGAFGRVVLINDKPLNAEQQKAEEERIRKATDPERMTRKQKQDQEDDAHTHKLLSAIPDAFDFTYVTTETAANGHKMVTVNFQPRPDFNPPNRETQVFTGMRGTLVVDQTAGRLAKVDGTLFEDVNFGWGILGRLYEGGRFVVEKAEVTPNHWDTTRMYLHFDGKVLLFKSLHIDEDETYWDFHRVQPMTVTQALQFLNRDTQSAMAETKPSGVNR